MNLHQMHQRDEAHYRAMLDEHRGATVGPLLAAQMIWACRHGYYSAPIALREQQEFRELVRRLTRQYGEHIHTSDVLAEMDEAAS